MVDLPGMSDINQTRVRASQQYLNNVDYIGVVSRVDRIETSPDTHRYLIDAFRRKRGASVLVIATNSDVSLTLTRLLHHSPDFLQSVNTKPHYLNQKINEASAIDAANLTTLRQEHDMAALDFQETSRNLRKARAIRNRDLIEELSQAKESLE